MDGYNVILHTVIAKAEHRLYSELTIETPYLR